MRDLQAKIAGNGEQVPAARGVQTAGTELVPPPTTPTGPAGLTAPNVQQQQQQQPLQQDSDGDEEMALFRKRDADALAALRDAGAILADVAQQTTGGKKPKKNASS